MNELTVLAEGSGGGELSGIHARDVRVEWDATAVELSPAAAEYLEKRWAVYLADAAAQGKTLFNAPITRLIAARREGDGGQARIVLRLGPADYKTFVVTRLRDRAWFEAHAPEAMALALGNSAFLTHGEEALLGIRSGRVSAYAGRAHLIGGVLELLGSEKLPADAGGVITHLLMELEEEAHIGENDLEGQEQWPRLVGVAHDEHLAQPEAVWQWETVLPLAEIASRLDASEHAGALIVRRGEMNDAAWGQMTPVARYAWRRWSGK